MQPREGLGDVQMKSKLHWKREGTVQGQQKRTQFCIEESGKWWDKEGNQLVCQETQVERDG